jgi:hypothetical protein
LPIQFSRHEPNIFLKLTLRLCPHYHSLVRDGPLRWFVKLLFLLTLEYSGILDSCYFQISYLYMLILKTSKLKLKKMIDHLMLLKKSFLNNRRRICCRSQRISPCHLRNLLLNFFNIYLYLIRLQLLTILRLLFMD